MPSIVDMLVERNSAVSHHSLQNLDGYFLRSSNVLGCSVYTRDFKYSYKNMSHEAKLSERVGQQIAAQWDEAPKEVLSQHSHLYP